MHTISIRVVVALFVAVMTLTALPGAAQTKTFRPGVPPLERKLAAVIIPSIDLEQSTLQEALEVLQIKIKKESKGNDVTNFIIRDSGKKFEQRAVTLQLEKIPADVLLQYIVNQVKGKIRYDKYAIVITPR